MTEQHPFASQPITQWLASKPDKIWKVECLQVADPFVVRVGLCNASISYPRESAEHRYCDTWQEAKEFLRKLAIEAWEKALAEERRTAELCTVITRMKMPEELND